ncbi:MAG: hypothetical protein R3F19_33515 [Verrucomicrobiales bacterium]
MGEIKQRCSQWYNRRSERNGPLWEDRFKSVLVQGEPGVLATVAVHDLNAVRAGIVKDPREWRWCGYAQLKGQGIARNGVYEVLGQANAIRRDGEAWKKVHRTASKAGAMKAAMALWVKEALENKETHASYSSFLDHVETELLKELLHHFDDKPTRLAEELRMNRTTLRRRCARLGIQDTADQ